MSGARTHRPQGAAWEAVKDIPGITYRRFDHWCSKGYIRFDIERGKSDGSGNWRTLPEHEVRVVSLMVDLIATLGLRPDAAEPLARALAAGATMFGNFRIERMA
jgi:hypothetical protein